MFKLSNTNFLEFAMNHYSSPVTKIEEFEEDVNRLKYLKKLLVKYQNKNDLKLRLILNHLIVLYNVFSPPEACTRMICLRLKEYLPQIKPFLIVLHFWNDGKIEGIEELPGFYGSDVPLDQKIVNALREEFKEFRIE